MQGEGGAAGPRAGHLAPQQIDHVGIVHGQHLVQAPAAQLLGQQRGGGLAVAMKDEGHREAALVTFLVAASGLTPWGVGAAFWGVVAGALALAAQR